MSDQALVWKLAFGGLVLVFCAVAYVGRKDTQPPASLGTNVPLRVAPAPEPLPAASMPPSVQEPAPVDMPDAQETPVRIHISLAEPAHSKPTAPPKTHRAAKHMPPAKLHLVRASHSQPGRSRHASPYAAGRQHYPFDPRERWRTREG